MLDGGPIRTDGQLTREFPRMSAGHDFKPARPARGRCPAAACRRPVARVAFLLPATRPFRCASYTITVSATEDRFQPGARGSRPARAQVVQQIGRDPRRTSATQRRIAGPSPAHSYWSRGSASCTSDGARSSDVQAAYAKPTALAGIERKEQREREQTARRARQAQEAQQAAEKDCHTMAELTSADTCYPGIRCGASHSALTGYMGWATGIEPATS